LMRSEVDLADFRAVERLFARERPSGVIHCAASSRSPACQADPAAARVQNVAVTRRLAELAAEIPMVFLSSDLVFDGRRNGAEGGYREDDAVNPLSVYAETKVEAESWVRRNSRHAIVRTSLNFGRSPSGPGAFNEELATAWRAGRVVDLFVDEFRARLRRWRRRGGCGRCWIRGRVGCFTSPVRSACRGTRLDNSWLRISGVRSPVWVRQCGRVRWRGIPGHPVLPTRLWTARSWPPCWANPCPFSRRGCAAGSRGDRLCWVPQRGTACQPRVKPRVWVCGRVAFCRNAA